MTRLVELTFIRRTLFFYILLALYRRVDSGQYEKAASYISRC